jgi:hypothetical protein
VIGDSSKHHALRPRNALFNQDVAPCPGSLYRTSSPRNHGIRTRISMPSVTPPAHLSRPCLTRCRWSPGQASEKAGLAFGDRVKASSRSQVIRPMAASSSTEPWSYNLQCDPIGRPIGPSPWPTFSSAPKGLYIILAGLFIPSAPLRSLRNLPRANSSNISREPAMSPSTPPGVPIGFEARQ